MEIVNSVSIDADIDTVWDIFTDLTCWKEWSTVLGESSSEHARLTEGKRFNFCIRPFTLPVHVQPLIQEVLPGKRIIWSGTKHGIHARHEFIFSQEADRVILKSREIFQASPLRGILFYLSKKKLHKLSEKMLQELKEAAEKEGD